MVDTLSRFPVITPCECHSSLVVIAIFSASCFAVPGGFDIRVDLLYALENRFATWSERRLGPGIINDVVHPSLKEDSFVFTVHLTSSTQLELALGLFKEVVAEVEQITPKSNPKSNRLQPVIYLAERLPLTFGGSK